MEWLNIAGIAVALAMDAFAVSIVAGLAVRPLTGRHVFRIGFHFGLFQFIMPVGGWYAGTYLAGWIDAWDHWVAFGLLLFVGLKMILESRADIKPDSWGDPTRGWMLVTLSVATSIDAFAAGLGMALLGTSVLVPAVIIGVVAAAFSTTGICFGSRIGPYFGRKAILAGGVILVSIGMKIVIWG